MAQLPKQPVPLITHGGTDQKHDKFLLTKERLTQAHNVHQPRPGILSKRNGYSKLPILSDVQESTQNESDEYILSAGRGLASNGETLVARTNRGVYVKTDATETGHWERKAEDHLVQVKPLENTTQFGYRPTSIVAGDLTYYFFADAGDWKDVSLPQDHRLNVGDGTVLSNRASEWYYKVLDSDGVEVKPTTIIENFVGWMVLPALDAAGLVWLFAPSEVAGSATVYAAKFIPATIHPEYPTDGTEPTITLYYEEGSADIWGLDVMNNDDGDVVVCIRGEDLPATDASTYNTIMSILDPATGTADTSLGFVGSDVGADPPSQECVSFVRNATLTDYYVTISGAIEDEPAPASTEPTIARFRAADLTLLEYNVLATTGSSDDYAEATTFRDPDTGYMVTFATGVRSAPSGESWDFRIHRFEHDPADWSLVNATLDARFRTFVASQLFVVNSRRYLIIGQDDNGEFSQCSYMLMDASRRDMPILARVLYGAAGGYQGVTQGGAQSKNIGWLSPIPASNIGTRSVNVVLPAFNGSDFYGAEIGLVFDDPSLPEGEHGRLGPMAVTANGEEIAVPSAWPLHVVGTEAVEAAPPVAPPFAPTCDADTASPLLALAAGDYVLYYSYVWQSPKDGGVIESAPSPPSDPCTVAGGETITVTVQSLVPINSGDNIGWGIRIYMTAVDNTSGPPFLQTTIRNDPSDDTQDHTFNQSATLAGPTLYTYGAGALANTPPEGYGFAAAWGSRLLLMDTAEFGTVWVSKERRTLGLGYEFAIDLTFNVSQTARIHCGGEINEQFFALMSADSIYYIQAPGPDGLGRGMYEPLRIESDGIGCTNPHSVSSSKYGLMFQGTDGRIKLITPSLQFVDINDGVESFRGALVEAVVNDHATQQVRFFAAFDPPPEEA